MTTRSVGPAATVKPGVPDTSTPASPAGPQMIEMALVMVSAPKPPPSRQLISPPGAVLEIEPAKVLHGAVRLHGLASSPTPETHVRVACAFAGTIGRPIARAKPRRPNHILRIFMPRSHCYRFHRVGLYRISRSGSQQKIFCDGMNLQSNPLTH